MQHHDDHDDHGPQNWEADSDCEDYDAYARSGGLDRMRDELDAALDRERFEAIERIVGLRAAKGAIAEVGRGADEFSLFGILGPLALLVHEEAQRLGGVDVDEVARARGRGTVADRGWTGGGERIDLGQREAPFASVGAALAFAIEPRVFGVGSPALRDDADEKLLDKETLARVRLQTIAAARAEMYGRPLPPAADGAPSAGFLPADFMPARQSRNGNLGGSRGESGVDLRLDVLAAIRRSGLPRVDLALLVLADVGDDRAHVAAGADKRCWCGKHHAPPREGVATLARHVERMKLRPGQLANLIAPHVATPLSGKRVGQIVAHARATLAEKLVERAVLAPRAPKKVAVEEHADDVPFAVGFGTSS